MKETFEHRGTVVAKLRDSFFRVQLDGTHHVILAKIRSHMWMIALFAAIRRIADGTKKEVGVCRWGS
jgi:hypothetical protein